MLVKCTNDDFEIIKQYIGDDYASCLYLYMDLIKYGPVSGYTNTWIQKEAGGITCVILSYHSAMHIFSRDGFDIPEVVDLVNGQKPSQICAAKSTILALKLPLSELNYEVELGYVGKIEYSGQDKPEIVQLAKLDDVDSISRLLYNDEGIGASYTLDDLKEQFTERLSQGFVRSYVIKDEVGIHARPAGILVKEAKKYASTISVVKDGKAAAATKLMALMGLGVKCGDTVQIPSNTTWNGLKAKCRITDTYGNVIDSNPSTVTLIPYEEDEFRILTQPKNTTDWRVYFPRQGSTYSSLSVNAYGTDLSYQWYFRKADQTAWSEWEGATDAVSPVIPDGKGYAYCVVTNTDGEQIYSDIASYQVTYEDD